MLRGLLTCLLGLALAGPAGAMTFYFNAYGGFTDPDQGLVPPTPSRSFGRTISYQVPNDFDQDVASSQRFRWGRTRNGGENSYITINELAPHQDPEIFEDHIFDSVTVGDRVGTLAMRLQHHNFEILLRMDEPDPVAIHYHIDIYATPEDAANQVNALFETGPMDITLEVWETGNFGSCPNPNDVSGCDDRLEYGFGWLSDSVGDSADELLGSFQVGENSYDVFFTGLFDADGSISPTFWSPEGEVSTAFATVRIVPEPATASLLALGLLGLVAAGRRRA